MIGRSTFARRPFDRFQVAMNYTAEAARGALQTTLSPVLLAGSSWPSRVRVFATIVSDLLSNTPATVSNSSSDRWGERG